MTSLNLGGYCASIAISLSVLCILISLQLALGKVVYQFFSYDLFVVLEGVLHLQYGHRPHIDFSSPVGILYLIPYYITTFFGPLRGMTVVYGNALFGVLAFGLAAAASRERLPPVWAGVFSFYVGLLSISPRLLVVEGGPLNFMNQAFYNRFAWSLFCILCLTVSLPRQNNSGKADRNVDAAICALLLFSLFYMKITYFLAGIGLLAMSLITVQRDRLLRNGGRVLAIFVGLMAAMELATGITVPYLRDLASTAAAAPAVFRGNELARILLATYHEHLLILSVGAVSAALGGVVAGVGKKAFLLIALMGAGLAVATYNVLGFEIPIVPVVALIALMLFSPRMSPQGDTSWGHSVLAGIVALIFLQPIVLDAGALVRAVVRSSAQSADVIWLRDTTMSDLAISDQPNLLRTGENKGPYCCEMNDNEYLYVVSDGVSLLRSHMSRPARVFSLGWSNPFPTLLGGPPIKHSLLWWDQGRTFSSASHPPGTKLLDEVDYVLISKVDVRWSPRQMMGEIYAEELRTMFMQLDESRYWTLLAKR
jgi:hypothetical protein